MIDIEDFLLWFNCDIYLYVIIHKQKGKFIVIKYVATEKLIENF